MARSQSLFDLLENPLFSIEGDEGRSVVTLPGLLARLSRGVPTSLTALQAHQHHPVHAFLVQLAVLALVRGGELAVEHDEAAWRALLLETARKDGGGPEAFTLVVDDLSKPAFLQPPVPEGKLDALKSVHERPSAELDVLITAKNHDIKMDRLGHPSVEHWVYALITLQTMQGFLGAGNYGIARMNGGFSSRPCVAFAPGVGLEERFARDVRVVLKAREGLLERFSGKRRLGLVWCAPWDGGSSIALADLDPFFIEVCRRVRLVRGDDSAIVAHRGSSKVARIEGKAANGNTGDAWTPVSSEGKALTMSEDGFTYGKVSDLLFGEWSQGAAGAPQASAGDLLWLGQVLVRGQGKTGGYQERWLPVPARVISAFMKRDERQRIAVCSRQWVELAGDARLRVLKPALLVLLQGAPDKLKFDDDRGEPYLARFDAAIDAEFFGLLFEHALTPAAENVFQRRLADLAREQLESAMDALPVPTARRWRAIAKAEGAFYGARFKHLPLAYPPPAPAGGTTVEGAAL